MSVLMVVVLLVGATGVFAGPPEPPQRPAPGPAPNSGDGIPDGSGFDDPPPRKGDLPDSSEDDG